MDVDICADSVCLNESVTNIQSVVAMTTMQQRLQVQANFLNLEHALPCWGSLALTGLPDALAKSVCQRFLSADWRIDAAFRLGQKY